MGLEKGVGGGIAVLWRRGVDVTLRNLSEYHIDMDVREEDGGEWRFTGVYGESRTDLKDKTWTMMRSLICTPAKPWMLAGDFNEILFAHEKEGGGRSRSGAWINFGMS